jgi:transcription elongation GreA/GreB family factor
MRLPAKQQLKAELIELMTRDLEVLERAHEQVIAAATHEEAKPENDKDTRALEQSYLARGQALRVKELRTALLEVEAMVIRTFGEDAPIAVGALLKVDEAGEESHLLLAAHGGGSRLAGGAVQVVSVKSPLGRALLGKRAGEDVDVRLPERTRELSILSVE